MWEVDQMRIDKVGIDKVGITPYFYRALWRLLFDTGLSALGDTSNLFLKN